MSGAVVGVLRGCMALLTPMLHSVFEGYWLDVSTYRIGEAFDFFNLQLLVVALMLFVCLMMVFPPPPPQEPPSGGGEEGLFHRSRQCKCGREQQFPGRQCSGGKKEDRRRNEKPI